jgi:PAS domain-containing protein
MFIIRKDGSEVIVELTGSFTIYHNKRANVLYIRDITIRKEKEKKLLQSEERFHRLFDYSPVSLVELDYSELKKYLDQLRSQGVTDFKQYFKMNTDILVKCDSKIKVLNSNITALHLWEIDTFEELNEKIFGLHKAEPEIGCYGDVFIAFAEGKINFEYEEDCKTAKGNWQHRQVQVRVAPGCEDTLSHVYIATLDISKHKMMEEQLKEYQMHLEELVERRSVELLKTSDKLREQIKQRIEFTRALVHDLKTPLTPMMAASGTIAAGIKDEPWKSLSTRIYRGTLSLSKRINELLDLTKVIWVCSNCLANL